MQSGRPYWGAAMAISVARQQVLLSGQTTAARKVFEAVPIREAWPATQIHTALQRTTRSTMDFKIVQGCLNSLISSGLVTEPRRGFFERVKPREQVLKPMSEKTDDKNGNTSEAVQMLLELADQASQLSDNLHAAAAVIEEEHTQNAESLRKLEQLRSLLKNLS